MNVKRGNNQICYQKFSLDGLYRCPLVKMSLALLLKQIKERTSIFIETVRQRCGDCEQPSDSAVRVRGDKCDGESATGSLIPINSGKVPEVFLK